MNTRYRLMLLALSGLLLVSCVVSLGGFVTPPVVAEAVRRKVPVLLPFFAVAFVTHGGV